MPQLERVLSVGPTVAPLPSPRAASGTELILRQQLLLSSVDGRSDAVSGGYYIAKATHCGLVDYRQWAPWCQMDVRYVGARAQLLCGMDMRTLELPRVCSW